MSAADGSGTVTHEQFWEPGGSCAVERYLRYDETWSFDSSTIAPGAPMSGTYKKVSYERCVSEVNPNWNGYCPTGNTFENAAQAGNFAYFQDAGAVHYDPNYNEADPVPHYGLNPEGTVFGRNESACSASSIVTTQTLELSFTIPGSQTTGMSPACYQPPYWKGYLGDQEGVNEIHLTGTVATLTLGGREVGCAPTPVPPTDPGTGPGPGPGTGSGTSSSSSPTPGAPGPTGPSTLDALCRAGEPAGDITLQAMGIGEATGTFVPEPKALGQAGVVLGVVDYACTARALPGVDTYTATYMTGACAGLKTFSLGVGAGSLVAAGTVVGLPAAAVGGVISLVSGVMASVPCAYQSPNAAGSATLARRQAAPVQNDVKYRRIAVAAPVRVKGPRLPAGVSRRVKSQLSALRANAGRTVGFGRALRACISRAAAAKAARQRRWERRQSKCAASNAAQLARRYRAHARIHRRVAAAMKAARMKEARIDAGRARGVLTAFPQPVVDSFRGAGLSDQSIGVLQRSAAARARNLRVPRTFTDALTGRRFQAVFTKAARDLDRVARHFAALAKKR